MEKVALSSIFGVGLVCVVMAIVRTVSVGMESRSDNTPSSSWLMLWGLIETAIGKFDPFASAGQVAKFASSNDTCAAVVVGTLPVFAIFFRRRQYTRRYGSYPNDSEPRNPSRSHRSDPDRTPNSTHEIKLSAINVTRTLEVS